MKTTHEWFKYLETLSRRPKFRYTIIDIYETFPFKDEIEKDNFLNICKTFNALFVKHLVETGNVLRVPNSLGTLSIRKRKSGKRKNLDLIHLARTGEKRYIKNKHSENYYARYHWSKKFPYLLTSYPVAYKLVMSRKAKRFLSSSIKNNNTINKYYEYE
jgi:hypothetical protein